MPDGANSGLSFGSGIARGLASVYGRKREREDTQKFEAGQRQRQMAGQFIDIAMKSGNVKDMSDLDPYMEMWLGMDGQKKPAKGEHNPKDLMSQLFTPHLSAGGAAAPTGGSTAVAGPSPAPPAGTNVEGNTGLLSGAGGDPLAATATQSPAPAAAPSPAGPGSPAAPAGQSLGGVQMRTAVESEVEKLTAIETAKFALGQKRAKDLYESMKGMDGDRTLLNAMKAAGFSVDVDPPGIGGAGRGSDFAQQLARINLERLQAGKPPLTSDEAEDERASWYAQNRSMGTSLESVSRMMFEGRPPQLLTPEELTAARARVTDLIGTDSYTRTASTAAADYNKQLGPAAAQATNLPSGVRAPEVAGQQILTKDEIETRRSTETLRDTLTDIRDRLIDPALPDETDLGGLLPGAWLSVARNTTRRNEVSALEAAVNNVVNVVARTVAQQKGTQTEKDAARAEAAIVNLQTALFSPLKGDTRQSAKIRINESLKIIEEVLGKLPSQATPQGAAGAAGDAAPVDPSMTSGGVNRRNRARQVLLSGGYQTDDKTIDTFLKNNPGFK